MKISKTYGAKNLMVQKVLFAQKSDLSNLSEFLIN